MSRSAFEGCEGDRLWGGRFKSGPNPCFDSLNRSVDIDKRMYAEDIAGSVAYAGAIHNAGLITNDEKQQMVQGLEQVKDEWETNTMVLTVDDEDIHTANERRLKEIIGVEVGGKLHTGRSRNDQVATDMRLWLRRALAELQGDLHSVVRAAVQRADEYRDVIMPGYTHLQRAQPVRWSHWLLSHAWSLHSDSERLRQLDSRAGVMTLGSGALAGNPFDVNREELAAALGFLTMSPNSMYAVSDRDFVAEFLFMCSLCAVHLSRLAEDVIIFCSREFGFVKLDDTFSTGSSLMPQKRNPDSMELVRGKAGAIFGQCCGFMMTLKGLPSTYNKDFQEDKAAMFGAYDALKETLQVTRGALDTLKVDKVKCHSALSTEMLSTDLAYHLVRSKGVPFREAHNLAGQAVAFAEGLGVALEDVPVSELSKISGHFDESMACVWDFEHSVEQYTATGGTAMSSVQRQIEELTEWLNTEVEYTE